MGLRDSSDLPYPLIYTRKSFRVISGHANHIYVSITELHGAIYTKKLIATRIMNFELHCFPADVSVTAVDIQDGRLVVTIKGIVEVIGDQT